MGWTSCHASYYKNGKVDRKAECDAYFMEGFNRGHFNVLKSAMIGSTYYAAVQNLLKCTGKNEGGEYQYAPIPQDERTTFAVVFLTSTNMKEYHNFYYKDMDESCGPRQCDCPKGILDLLSPTESQWANDWRKACYENIAKKKRPNGLSKLPVDTVIKVVMPCDTNHFKQGQEVRLKKRTKWTSNRTEWVTQSYPVSRFTPGLMRMLEDHYEIIERGGAQ